jgi:peptidoglycan lytic transglycosylase
MPISKAATDGRSRRARLLLAVVLLLSGCAGERPPASRYEQSQDSAPARLINVSQVRDAVPRDEPRSRYGNPQSYVVRGKRYRTLASSKGYCERGIASWYGTKFHGYRTSSGDTYDMYGMSAAHKTLPLPTFARVTNLSNGKSVIVRINDRGPFHENRLIDLSYAAASRLGILGEGTGLVEVKAIDPASDHEAPPAPRIAPSQPKVSVTAAKPSPSPSPSAAHRPSLYLQLGAFSNRDNAERLQAKLDNVKLPGDLQIIAGVTSNRPVYRVRIGPLANVESADRLTRLLADHGIHDPRVVID